MSCPTSFLLVRLHDNLLGYTVRLQGSSDSEIKMAALVLSDAFFPGRHNLFASIKACICSCITKQRTSDFGKQL
ncbi:DNA excision repair protein ERCC-6-like 2 [Clarias magur]|uniref:DNA excision repair protein ERCC-6-like 2 n=1 Tax=Clarias magur TaxID=1594786 RepID=A0A8J4T5V8_CLAMG|nr:DNA excision repair protein ERCC-6-like 2 [Clarias magur]